MAIGSARAPAQPDTPPASPDPATTTSAALDPASLAATIESQTLRLRRAASLALRAGDEASGLRDVMRAYACLQLLIAPVHRCEGDEEFPATRSELAALVGLVNEALDRRIEDVDAAIQSVREVLSEGGAS